MNDAHFLTTIEALESHYELVNIRSVQKEIHHIDEHCRTFIAASPFFLLATNGASGADCSPRGDPAGFVQVLDDNTLLIPDRRGNNRIDSLRNIIENPEVGLLFLVPGANETLRVNGKARISVDPDLCAAVAMQGTLPATVLVVTVEQVFIQCSRALVRADLWNPEGFSAKDKVPTIGTFLAAHTKGKVDAAEYDAQVEGTVRQTLYARADNG